MFRDERWAKNQIEKTHERKPHRINRESYRQASDDFFVRVMSCSVLPEMLTAER
jgi:hypothetical protein